MTRWFHPEFQTDLIDAARYCQGQRPALGAEFIDEAEAAVEEIMRAPERWPVRVGRVRRFLLNRFPCIIRYRISDSGDTVQFLSLLHGAAIPATGLNGASEPKKGN
ncbi:MAG: type II toxin-antitoxin system RelE/ParE family toxin [Verrucomicrobiota bacterium]